MDILKTAVIVEAKYYFICFMTILPFCCSWEVIIADDIQIQHFLSSNLFLFAAGQTTAMTANNLNHKRTNQDHQDYHTQQEDSCKNEVHISPWKSCFQCAISTWTITVSKSSATIILTRDLLFQILKCRLRVPINKALLHWWVTGLSMQTCLSTQL